MRRGRVIQAFATLLVPLIASCGSRGSDEDLSTWAAQICAQAESALTEVTQPFAQDMQRLSRRTGVDALRDYRDLLDTADRDLRLVANRVEGIEAPTADAAEFQRSQRLALNQLAEALAAMRRDVDAYFQSGETAAIEGSFGRLQSALDARKLALNSSQQGLSPEVVRALDSHDPCGELGSEGR